MSYTRNSVLRARGINPRPQNTLRAANRRLVETNAVLDRAATVGASLMVALGEIKAVTGPVVERARERGTDASGTIRKIDRIARAATTISE